MSEDGMDDSGDGRFIEGPLQDDVFHPGERTLPPSPDSPGSDATNQFYIGEIEDNEEIKISASTYLNSIAKKIGHSMSPVTKATVPMPSSSGPLADICNSNAMHEREEPNVLTNQLTCTINKPLTKPNNLSLASNCTPSAAKMHRDNDAKPGAVQTRYQNGQSSSACLLDNRVCTSRSLVARRSGRMRNENIRIHVRECVLVLIVFTFLSLCFGISCGRFVATVLGLHIIYAVSKSLLEK